MNIVIEEKYKFVDGIVSNVHEASCLHSGKERIKMQEIFLWELFWIIM